MTSPVLSAPPGPDGPWWDAGLWLGRPDVGRRLVALLGRVAAVWQVLADARSAPTAGQVVINALPLEALADIDGACAAVEELVSSPRPPRRVVTVVPGAWLGRGPSPRRSAQAAAMVAHSRHLALRLAPSGTTVNIVSVPEGFPGASPGVHAIERNPVDVVDLAHVARFFAHPANGYVLGQVVSLCGGEDVWSNHGL